MTKPVLNLPPLSCHQRALRRAGIQTGVLEVDYQPEPPFFADQRQRYCFARLTLGRPRDNSSLDQVLTLKFQRHLLTGDGDATPTMVSHPRFDFGLYPWSHFYGPKIIPDALPLPEAHKLRVLMDASSALGKLVSSPEVTAALGQLSRRIYCDLTAYLAVLDSQGVTIRVLHHLNGGTYRDEELLADPERFHAGPAASFIAHPSAPAP